MYIHTSLFVSFKATFSNGLLTNNSTWCQNRGCICISSVRRTYGQIHMHPAYIQTSTIILWTELFPKKRREKIQGENFNLHSNSNPRVFPVHNPAFLQELQVFPHVLQSSTLILHTELILPQEILQLQGSSRADHYKASSSDCSPCIQAFYTAE